MLELIDQSQPTVLRYRCTACHVIGVSTPIMAIEPDHAFWIATPGAPKPGRWVNHECKPEDVVAAQAFLEAQAKAAATETAAREANKRAQSVPTDVAGLQTENAALRARLAALEVPSPTPKRTRKPKIVPVGT